MLEILVLAATLVLTQAAPPAFKPSANPVSDAARQSLAEQSKHLIDAAALMPADKYGYHPTDGQMTFGKLVVHVAQTNTLICSAIGNLPASSDVMKLADSATKDALVEAMTQSFSFCTEALGKVTDAQLGEEVSMMGRRTGQSRGAAVITITSDWADHYSTAASYLRLNGILPPTAPPKK
jgi:uncharacterized damage-inducible protein DinB